MKKLKKQRNMMNVALKDTYRRLVGVMMTQVGKDSKYAQVNIKEGIKRYGQKTIEALVKELGQLDDKDTFDPQLASSLTEDETTKALSLLSVIKQKRCGKIKGRVVADGRKQRNYVPREEATSPTIKLESLIMSLLVDAKEKRDVATADIVGAYLLADMKDKVVVKLTGRGVDILCEAKSTESL